MWRPHMQPVRVSNAWIPDSPQAPRLDVVLDSLACSTNRLPFDQIIGSSAYTNHTLRPERLLLSQRSTLLVIIRYTRTLPTPTGQGCLTPRSIYMTQFSDRAPAGHGANSRCDLTSLQAGCCLVRCLLLPISSRYAKSSIGHIYPGFLVT
jgi:hypothetical protein